MAKDPIFPLYYNDILGSTKTWTDEEFGAYVRLLIDQWDKGFLPVEMMRLNKIADSLGKNWALISAKFKETEPGKLQNLTLEMHRINREKFKNKQSENGSKGGRPKNNKRSKTQTKTQTYPKKKPLEVETEKEREGKEETKGGVGEIVLPFQTETFKTAWGIWKAYKEKTFRFKFKTPESEQASLKLLSKFDETFTIGLIERAMANQYKGLVFDSTYRDYQNYLTEKNNGNKHTTKTGQSAGQKPHGLTELRNVSAQILEGATGTSDSQASD